MKDGFINILKPPGMTSHDVISFVRRTLGTKKAGHAGTLDPGAAGVLPVAVGHATRLLPYLGDVDKAYRAELLLGIETDSGDDTGNILQEKRDFALPDEAALAKAAAALTGIITQVPPVYSAIKIGGKRACDLARQDIAVEIPSREVEIKQLQVLRSRDKKILLDVECSKGTYIRTLCTDFGRQLGIPATMSFLVRRRVGSFRLAEAVTLEELAALKDAAVQPAENYLEHLPVFELFAKRIAAFGNGLSTRVTDFGMEDCLLRVYGKGRFLGIGRFDAAKGEVIPERLYMAEENILRGR